MNPSQRRALVSLLEEGDTSTIELVKAELIQAGPERLLEVNALLENARGSARAALLDVVRSIESAESLGAISRSLARLRTFAQLEELCWQLARSEQPEFDGGPYRRQLDLWAAELKPQIRSYAKDQEVVAGMARFFNEQQRLTGNSHDYYHPRNCHLPWVLEFRSGLPVTLTLVYILVGQRVGIEIEGIRAPGHFLARLGSVIFDPYYNGRVVTDQEWDRIRSEIPPSKQHMLNRAASPVQIMHHLLLSLRNSYVKRNDLQGRKNIDHYLSVLQR